MNRGRSTILLAPLVLCAAILLAFDVRLLAVPKDARVGTISVLGIPLGLRTLAVLQGVILVLMLIQVIVFARWVLQPYRRLLRAAGHAPGAGGPGEIPREQADDLVAAFQGVLDKLRAQEEELLALKKGHERPGGAGLLGDRLVSGMSSAVLVFDRGGALTVLNSAALKLLGWTRGDAVGRPVRDLLAGSARLSDLVERCLRTGEGHSREVVTLARRSGREAHLGAMIAPIRPAAAERGEEVLGVDGVLCLLADLTEIKSLRERVGLKENLAAVGELSAGIAHQFRNSLATIQSFARLAERAGGEGKAHAARDHASGILREVSGIRKIVDDFLRFARPLQLDLEEIDLRALVEDVVGDFRGAPLAEGVRLEVEGTFPRLVADETLLRQALHDLIRNAAESFLVPPEVEGGPAPESELPLVRVRGTTEGAPPGGARIIVEDNGSGMEPDDLAHIFTPFFTTKEGGTGLGLALVRKTAVLHDGQVEVESRKGWGTRFTLSLPARPGGTPAPGPLS